MASVTERQVFLMVRRCSTIALSWCLFVVLCLVVQLSFTRSAVAAATEVQGVRLWRAPDHTRLVFDLSGEVEFKTLALDKPERVVIDLVSARFSASADELDFSNTPILKLRSAKRNEDDVRIVLDLGVRTKISSFTLPKNEQYGHRLVVDLYDLKTPPGTDNTQSPIASQGAKPLPSERRIEDVLAEDKTRDIIIAIDAGHGGEDPGAIGPRRIREKNVVLAISKQLEKIIDASPGFEAKLVRTGDYYIPLAKRVSIARKQRADLMISVHADAFHKSSARGASVYALSQRGATSENARYLAERENRADLIGGSGGVSLNDKDKMLAQVILDLSMTATLSSSLQVGNEVLKTMGGVARLHKRQVEQAGFVVLKSPDIPSILVETGFISNPGEAEKLNRPAYREKMAKAIFAGVKQYFTNNPPDGTLLAMQRKQGLLGGAVHVIERGDTLSGIALRYRVSVTELKQLNGLSSPVIRVGQKLKIPLSS